MNDHDLLLEIQELLDGVEWTHETLEKIASLLHQHGYQIRGMDNLPLW